MVRPLFYRTDSHRSRLEDVKCRVKGHDETGERANGKSVITKESTDPTFTVASSFFTLLLFSHVLQSLRLPQSAL